MRGTTNSEGAYNRTMSHSRGRGKHIRGQVLGGIGAVGDSESGNGLLDLSPWGCMRTGSEVGVQGERINSRSPIFLKKIILI